MKKWIVVMLMGILVAGCAQLGQIASYRVSQAQLEQLLRDQIDEMNPQISFMGLSAPLEVKQLNLEVGPDETDLVRLHSAFTLTISGLGMSYPIGIEMSVEGSPYYNHEQHAVYVRNLDILNASIDAGGYRGSVGFLNREVKEILDELMAETPVYRLSEDNPRHRMLMRVPISMQVESGGIRFSATANQNGAERAAN